MGISRKQISAGLQKLPLDLSILKLIERPTALQDEIEAGPDSILVVSKNFAKTAFGSIALHGITDCGPGSDEPHARGSRLGRRHFALDGRRLSTGPQNKTAAMIAAALVSHPGEINRPSQVRIGSEAHGAPAVIWVAG